MSSRPAVGRFDPPRPGEPTRPCPTCPPGRDGRIALSRPRKKICHLCDKEKQRDGINETKRARAAAARKAQNAAANRSTLRKYDSRASTPAKDMDKIRIAYRALDAAHRNAASLAIGRPDLYGGTERIVKNADLKAALSALMGVYAAAANLVAPILWPPPPVGPDDFVPSARLVEDGFVPPPPDPAERRP